MIVKTLKPHENAYGEKLSKGVGDSYEHPAPEQLIRDEIVEKDSGDNGKGRGAKGA